jgi:hypothetical protein
MGYRQNAAPLRTVSQLLDPCSSLTNQTIDCCARRLLSMQPDFLAQRSESEETIESESGRHRTLFYPKFHCELNHIEFFWCHSKRGAREECDYSIEGLRQHVPEALANVRNSTILACSKSCLAKMDLYRRGHCIWIRRVEKAHLPSENLPSRR